MEKSTILFLLFLSCAMYFIGTHARITIEVKKRFSKSYLKKNKGKGAINRLLCLKYQKIRPLGIWFWLNLISVSCVLILLVISLFIILSDINGLFVFLFSIIYIIVVVIALIANIKGTQIAFKSKGASTFSTHLSIGLISLAIIIISTLEIIYLWDVYII